MKNNFATHMLFCAVLAASATTACRESANTNVNSGSAVSSTNATPVGGGNDNPASAAPAAATALPVAAPAASVSGAATPAAGSTTNVADKTPQQQRPAGTRDPKLPQPQIGSGGNDFFLYTRARAALNADAEFKPLVIEVHNGVVTLTGKVLNDGQKQRAARIAQGVQGVKSVTNELRVTSK